MRSRFTTRLLGLLALALIAAPRPANALLNIDGTRNQVFVFGNAALAYDSNLFASADGGGDYIYGASVGVELKRRAGIISVNASATFDYQKYAEFTDQSGWNPSFYLELNKTVGRTTGAFTLNAVRSSRADSAVNLRTQTWNFPLGLNIKYPVNDKFYVTSASGYLRRSYSDSAAGLLTYTDYSQAFDLFYVYTSKLDLLGGYRLRVGNTTLGTTTDQAFTVGVANGILPKVNGTLRVGFQIRHSDLTGDTYTQLTSTAGLTWTATRKFTANLSVSRDFQTTAIGGNVDTLSALLRGVYQYTRQFSMDASIGGGRNLFLGGTPRTDTFFSWDVGARYRMSEHLDVGASYNYLKNWSTVSRSDFERSGYSVNVSSRY